MVPMHPLEEMFTSKAGNYRMHAEHYYYEWNSLTRMDVNKSSPSA